MPRPRVSKYSGVAGDRFSRILSRNFSGVNTVQRMYCISDESMSFDYSYYLPRIDRIYLDKEGLLSVKQGAPADNPGLP